jgi:phosphohistidine phosphatase
MEIYLVRHAIAHTRDPERWPDDGGRPLKPSGVQGFRRVARGLRTLVPEVDVVLSSPLVRAWQTAEILHECARWPEPSRRDALRAGGSPARALEALESYSYARRVALVGHEPDLQELISLLLTGDPGRARLDVKKGAVACVRFDGPPTAGAGVLLWLLPPRALRGLAP